MLEELQRQALEYTERGYSTIPLKGKEPLMKWARFRDEAATKEEVEKWFIDFKDSITGIGIITGYDEEIVVLDIEAEQDASGLNIPETVTAQSGGGGKHFYFKYPEGVTE